MSRGTVASRAADPFHHLTVADALGNKHIIICYQEVMMVCSSAKRRPVGQVSSGSARTRRRLNNTRNKKYCKAAGV